MDLFNYTAYIKQILPPKWRRIAWKFAFVFTLCKSLATIYQWLIDYEESTLFDINITPQVMVLESYLNRKTGLSNRLLFIVDTNINGVFDIYLSTQHSNLSAKIHSLMRNKIMAGSRFNIVLF